MSLSNDEIPNREMERTTFEKQSNSSGFGKKIDENMGHLLFCFFTKLLALQSNVIINVLIKSPHPSFSFRSALWE